MGLANRVLQKSANFVSNKAGKVITGLAAEGIESGAKFTTASAIVNGAEKISSKAMNAETKALIKEAKVAAAAKNHAAESALAFLGESTDDAGKTVKNAGRKISLGTRKASAGDAVENAVENVVENTGKKAPSGMKKSVLTNSAIGSMVGAGIGGATGIVTGADEDDIKGMIVTGALAGGAGGALAGGAKSVRNYKKTTALLNDIDDVAKDIATGKANHAIKDGAKGFLSKVGTSAQNIADKVDDIGYQVQHNYTGKKGKEASKIISEMQKAGDFDTIDKKSFVEGLTDGIKQKGATLGGAAQGAIIGSTGGAVIGGIAGGIDEDETVLGGALKGSFIGGALGGIGGGASGYFNNDAKILSNTVSNVNSLFGKNS